MYFSIIAIPLSSLLLLLLLLPLLLLLLLLLLSPPSPFTHHISLKWRPVIDTLHHWPTRRDQVYTALENNDQFLIHHNSLCGCPTQLHTHTSRILPPSISGCYPYHPPPIPTNKFPPKQVRPIKQRIKKTQALGATNDQRHLQPNLAPRLVFVWPLPNHPSLVNRNNKYGNFFLLASIPKGTNFPFDVHHWQELKCE